MPQKENSIKHGTHWQNIDFSMKSSRDNVYIFREYLHSVLVKTIETLRFSWAIGYLTCPFYRDPFKSTGLQKNRTFAVLTWEFMHIKITSRLSYTQHTYIIGGAFLIFFDIVESLCFFFCTRVLLFILSSAVNVLKG
jgi:hypothetical protein